jgi:hypothetical protein
MRALPAGWRAYFLAMPDGKSDPIVGNMLPLLLAIVVGHPAERNSFQLMAPSVSVDFAAW